MSIINGFPENKSSASMLNYNNVPLEYGNDIVASATTNNSTAYRAFDNNDSNYYNTASTAVPIRLSIDIGYSVVAKEFLVKAHTNITAFSIDGSTDGSNWNTLTEVSNTSSDLVKYDVSNNTTKYRYYSMNITAVSSSSSYVYRFQITKALSEGSEVTNVIPTMSSNTLSVMNNYLDLDMPLGSYKNGQIINVSLSSNSSDIYYQEKSFTSNIIPQFTSAANVSNEYGVWECSGAPNGSTYLMLDGDTSTYTSGGSKETSYGPYVGSVVQPDGTFFAIKPTKITVNPNSMSDRSITIRGYDFDTGAWDTLATGVSYTSSSTVTINTDKFYSRIGLYWTTGSTLAYLNYINEFSITAGTIRYGKLKPSPLRRIYNPLLNINDLGYKPINAVLTEGSKYGLVYNGNSFDVAYPYKILQGSYTSTTSISVDLGGRPKFLIVFGNTSSSVIAIVSDNLSNRFILNYVINNGTSNTPCYNPGYNSSKGSVTITDTGFTATEGFKTGNYIAVF